MYALTALNIFYALNTKKCIACINALILKALISVYVEVRAEVPAKKSIQNPINEQKYQLFKL